ncbi:hypothetical protein ABPG74_014045 [Tetrahymena malaccensis]
MTDFAPMKFIALVSGGKDSIFNIHKCVAQGHTLVAIANLYPADIGMEKDSYMYQSVGTNMIEAIGECLGVPVIRKQLKGKPVVLDLEYTGSNEEKSQDEVEDLYEILKEAKEKWDFQGVSSGAIASTYQKLRVEDVCKRLGLVSLAYLWGRDQQELLKEMVDQGMNSILIKVASFGLGRDHLGLSLRDNYDKIVALNAKFHLNVCGEGGEYESLTLDSPLYKKRIIIKESEVHVHSEDEYAPVYYLFIKSYELQDK